MRSKPPVHIECRRAFSLLEMMFVFILIGLLAGLVAVNARHYLVKGRQNAARAEIAAISTALETFYAAYGRYPSNQEGLAILATRSEKISDPLLKQVPTDPWGRPYQYNNPGQVNPYDVLCHGSDGKPGGEGADADISAANLKDSK